MAFLFKQQTEENIALNDPETGKTSAFGNLMKNVTNVFSSEPVREVEKTWSDKVIDFFEVEKSYTAFFIMIGFGGFLLFLSLLFLPIAVLAPNKFVSLFSLGSLISILSFIFIYGTREYLKMLFNSSRALLSILYFCSIFIGIYFSFNPSWFFISHICAVVQMITLITFVLSFIPGGQYGISFIWSLIKSPFVKS